MMDPTGGGGIGKAAGELMKEMQRAQQEMQQLNKTQQPGAAGSFDQVMQTQGTSGAQATTATQQVTATQEASKVLMQAKINANMPSTRVGAAAKSEESRLGGMLQKMIGGQDKMTQIMNMALSGRQFSPGELLAMQAGVYRFSQELELTSKVVEKATSGIKQTMNTQV
ncbi:MAG: ATP-dependent helicase HrpB [Deltaproteobacteria bacterium]|nr:ATP-dependent helicase HrpB [Deltaproteobacteria bacterium]